MTGEGGVTRRELLRASLASLVAVAAASCAGCLTAQSGVREALDGPTIACEAGSAAGSRRGCTSRFCRYYVPPPR